MVQHYGLIDRHSVTLRSAQIGFYDLCDRAVWAAPEPVNYSLVFDALFRGELADAAVALAKRGFNILPLGGLN